MFFHGVGNRVYPVTPHHLVLCALYEGIGHWLGLGDVGSAGKLMGLAAYGRPRFYDHAYAGNWNDWQRRGLKLESWVNQCMGMARDMGYDLTPVGHRERMTEPLCIDLAASTQKLFEEGMLAAAEAMHATFRRSGMPAENLCLSGGGALNCPANSRVYREGRFARMYVEPGCDDSGLAIGAAKFLYHNVFDQPLGSAKEEGPYASPYLGVPVSAAEMEAALARARNSGVQLDITQPDDAARAAAEDIAADRVIGWFEGRSEIGPRALGHRSILADARKGANWPRVNRIKGRESWRPFAPAVRESEAATWFRGAPNPSPYMLFTAAVASQDLPAITHTDGSARIQTVDPSCGAFFRVVEQFFAITGVPVVLNTSFNGPGEPIVETPDHALAFLARSDLDALYLGGWRVTRAGL
jgi:carbamoyltransferase